MTQSARVSSIDAIKDLKEALARFGADAAEALVSTDMEVRRAFDWLQDQLKGWEREVRHRQDQVAQARIELNRKKMSRIFDREPDTSEQEDNLRKAQARLHHAEDKVETCRRWRQPLQHAVTEYEGPARQLSGFLEVSLKDALALLERKIDALEAYVKLAVPDTASRGGTTEAAPAETTPAPVQAAATGEGGKP